MTIGVPKEIKAQEHRVALLPSGVQQLARNHRVLIESGAGLGVGVSNEQYQAVGAEIIQASTEVFRQSEMILKVKEPIPEEIGLLRPKQILFTYLHLAANRPLVIGLLGSGATCLAYESVQINRRLPLLEPMSEIAGRASAQIGAGLLSKPAGGRGDLIGGVPGVAPKHVVVLGGGTAGLNAARIAVGLGAKVTILEVDAERLRSLDLLFPGSVLFSTEATLIRLLPDADLVIGAVLLPGARAPKLLTRSLMRRLSPGSVFVDIAIDQGGCADTSRPTTHADPTYFDEGILHYCVANMPGAYPRTATQALTNATFPYIAEIAEMGLERAIAKNAALRAAVAISDAGIHHAAVADAHGLSSAFSAPGNT